MVAPRFDIFACLNMTDEDLGIWLRFWWLGIAIDAGAVPGVNSYEELKPGDIKELYHITEMFIDMDDDPGLEKALRLACQGKTVKAGRTCRAWIEHKGVDSMILFENQNVIRFRQRSAAMKPRPDSLARLIENIVKRKPSASAREIADRLEHEILNRKYDTAGITWDWDMNNELISWGGPEESGEAPLSGLKDRISRAKRKLISR